MKHIPGDLTPTESAAEGLISRDPLRRASDSDLELVLHECRSLRRLYAGTRESWRCDELWHRERRIIDEQRRRA